MSSVFFNKGENCIAAGRLFIEESIYDEYLRRIVEEIGKMVSADRTDPAPSPAAPLVVPLRWVSASRASEHCGPPAVRSAVEWTALVELGT